MSWVKLDDGFPKHPKVVGLPMAAKWLYIEGLCYASKYLTDGWIPKAILRDLGGTPRAVDALIDAKLWEPNERGYVIHNYTERQSSRAEIEQKREKDSARKRGGLRTESAHQKQRQKTETETETETEVAAVPAADDVGRCVRAYDGLMGSPSSTPPIVQKIADWLASSTVEGKAEWFEKACAEAAAANGKRLNYVLAILDRWQREGPEKRKESANGSGVGTNAGVVLPAFDFEAADRHRAEWEAKRMAAKAEGAVGDVHPQAGADGGELVEEGDRQSGELPRAGVRE